MTDFHFKPKLSRDEYGWHHRRLPHLDGECFTQCITFRLADSLPLPLLDKWRTEVKTDSDLRRRVEAHLDSGSGACYLREPAVAEIVRAAMYFYDKRKYDLHSWVIMPNHVHLVLTPFKGEHLSNIMHSVKSFSGLKANQAIGRSGQFWQHESFDRYIRDYRHFAAVVRYIERNPVKAGLCEKPEDWTFGSAFERENGGKS